MSEEDINRWGKTIAPSDKAPQPWSVKSGGSWDMLEVQPIPDEMLAELAQLYHSHGCPWNCKSMPLSKSDREFMYLLWYSMQGLVARMRIAERANAEQESELSTLRATNAQQAERIKELERTEENQQFRISMARGAASRKAWADLCARFSEKQKAHIANLLAHDWMISSIEMQSKYGGEPNRTDGTIGIPAALKAIAAAAVQEKAGG